MLSILGVGYAYPATVLDNKFIAGLNPSVADAAACAASMEKKTGVLTRFSSLTQDYLRDSANVDLKKTYQAAVETPTDLAVRATQMALARAGINAQDLGLIVADSSTPQQTIPAEATRIGKRLELKVPAFDVIASSASLAAHSEMLLDWKEESVARYALCVSTNTPTQYINYRECPAGAEASLNFGDGAAAMIVSLQVPGKLKVRDAFFSSDVAAGSSLRMPACEHLIVDSAAYLAAIESRVGEMLTKATAANALSFASKSVKFIGPQTDFCLLQRVCQKFSIEEKNHWHNVTRCGDSLGSGPLAVMAEHWDEIQPGDNIVVVLAGAGFSFGYVVFQA